MHVRHKGYLTIIFCFFTFFSYTQINTNSPYSRFGIGDLAKKGFANNHAMGGIAIGVRSPEYINYLNPASYSAQDSMSFIFNFGLIGNSTKFITSEDNLTRQNFNLHHLAVAFPVTKWLNTSAGLIPYSNVGYKLKEEISLQGFGTVINYYDGAGGINQFFWGNSIKLGNKLSVGFNASYLFGSIDQRKTLTFPDNESAFQTLIENRILIGDFLFGLGAQYSNNLNDALSYTIGLTFDNKTKLKAYQDLMTRNIISTAGGANIDTLELFTGKSSHLTIPTNLGIGITLKHTNKLIIGADYSFRKWSDYESLGVSDSLENSNTLNFGMEYTPDRSDFINFFKRIHYRLGGHFSNTYLYLKNNQIKDFGISFGVGIPFMNTRTSFNLSFEWGQRGTIKNNLLKENYAFISFSLTLYEFWFFKPKYD